MKMIEKLIVHMKAKYIEACTGPSPSPDSPGTTTPLKHQAPLWGTNVDEVEAPRHTNSLLGVSSASSSDHSAGDTDPTRCLKDAPDDDNPNPAPGLRPDANTNPKVEAR